MFKSFAVIFFLIFIAAFNKPDKTDKLSVSPLSSYSTEWDKPVYQKANTAANTKYLSQQEKELIWILNMARMNPSLFASTVVKKYPDEGGRFWYKNIDEYKSLLDTMSRLKALPLLSPDSLCWVSAQCHAIESGQKGYMGHDRQSAKCKSLTRFYGECCQYGEKEPLSMIMNLLVDEGVPSLGHRYVCLGYYYEKIGVSIRPHKQYGTNTVLDFY